MNPAKLTILGCGSARPTKQNSPAGQLLSIGDKTFLIDCGEGIQISMARAGVRTARLYNIFISHLHGDHCFGLIGLLSTLGMQGRTQPMHIYSHPDLEKLLRPWLDYYCAGMPYEVIFHPINPNKHEVIFEDRTILVETIPLKHTVPTCGFLFSERHRVMPTEPEQPIRYVVTKRYAYCSDTRFTDKIIPLIEDVQMLFHESTYTEEYADRCPKVMHSTARQAATIARQAGVGQLMLGHYSARIENHQLFLDEAKPVFENTLLAEEQKDYLW